MIKKGWKAAALLILEDAERGPQAKEHGQSLTAEKRQRLTDFPLEHHKEPSPVGTLI